jgi:signal transduction histidine kinase
MQWSGRAADVRLLGVPLSDLLLGTALAVFAVVDTAQQAGVAHPWTEIVAVAAAGSLVLRRRAPLPMAAIAATAIVILAQLPGASTPLSAFVTVLLLSFSVGAHLPASRAAAAVGLLLVAGYVLQLAAAGDPVERLITPPVIFCGPALAGWLLRRSRAQAEALRRLAADLEAVAVAERTRIAREMHDVIAHSVSVMVVQAGAAEQLMADGDPAMPHVRAVRGAGRDALGELRRMLGLLRNAEDATFSAPQPTLADLPALASDTGAHLSVHGELPPTVEPGMHLAAYRIVQEAVTNALRHARGASIEVLAEYQPSGVRISVENDGGPPAPPSGAGHGLTGMAERAALYGGRLQAGPRPGGHGWRVSAILPLPAEAGVRAVEEGRQ